MASSEYGFLAGSGVPPLACRAAFAPSSRYSEGVTEGATEYSSRLASGARSRRWISAVPLPWSPMPIPEPASRAAARPIRPRSTLSPKRTTRPVQPSSSRPASISRSTSVTPALYRLLGANAARHAKGATPDPARNPYSDEAIEARYHTTVIALMELERADVTDLVKRTLRRPPRYVSPGVFTAQLARKPAFARWQPEAFAAVALHTLRETADGGWQLRNPRELEAQIFASKPDVGHWQGMARLPCPTMLIAGDPASPFAAPGAHVARAIHEEMGTDYAFVPDTTHFLQLEAPQACREIMLSFLARHGLD